VRTPTTPRRVPRQRRARATVEAVLDAVARVVKREGTARLTTNRIAEAAGVSIGSLYQYFSDRRAILVALRDRHVAEMGAVVERRLVDHAAATLPALIRGLVEALIEAHALDPGLYQLLLAQVPPSTGDDPHLEGRLRGAVRLALAAHASELDLAAGEDRLLFVLTQMMESLAHAVVLHRPRSLSLAAAKEEAVRAVVSYVESYRRRPRSARARQQKGRR
jgi:AcrR family transcriptional regulator